MNEERPPSTGVPCEPKWAVAPARVTICTRSLNTRRPRETRHSRVRYGYASTHGGQVLRTGSRDAPNAGRCGRDPVANSVSDDGGPRPGDPRRARGRRAHARNVHKSPALDRTAARFVHSLVVRQGGRSFRRTGRASLHQPVDRVLRVRTTATGSGAGFRLRGMGRDFTGIFRRWKVRKHGRGGAKIIEKRYGLNVWIINVSRPVCDRHFFPSF